MTISEDGVEIVQPPEQDTAVVETSAPEPVLEPAPASEVDVEVVDDTPEQDRNRKPPAPDAKEYDPDEDDELKAYSENSRIRRRFATMKWQQHEQRRQREAAERQLNALADYTKSLLNENKRLFQESHLSRNATVTAVTAKLATEIEQAKAAFKQAYELGDAEAMSAAQIALAEATAKKQSVSTIPVADKMPDYAPPPLPNVQVDDGVTDRTRQWRSENPWFTGQNAASMYALEVHQALMQRGVPADSEDYYAAIDKAVRQKFPEVFPREAAPAKPAAPPQLKKTASIVAPVVSKDPATGKRKVTLTQSQIDICKKLGITPHQYAEQYAMEN